VGDTWESARENVQYNGVPHVLAWTPPSGHEHIQKKEIITTVRVRSVHVFSNYTRERYRDGDTYAVPIPESILANQ